MSTRSTISKATGAAAAVPHACSLVLRLLATSSMPACSHQQVAAYVALQSYLLSSPGLSSHPRAAHGQQQAAASPGTSCGASRARRPRATACCTVTRRWSARARGTTRGARRARLATAPPCLRTWRGALRRRASATAGTRPCSGCSPALQRRPGSTAAPTGATAPWATAPPPAARAAERRLRAPGRRRPASASPAARGADVAARWCRAMLRRVKWQDVGLEQHETASAAAAETRPAGSCMRMRS